VPESFPENSEDADAEFAVAVAGRFEPRWLRALALGSATAVAAFGAVGLVLAVAGIYRALLVFPLGAIAWFGLLLLARPILAAPGATDLRAHVVSALAVVFAGGIAFWHAKNASQHVLINRDGGSYVNAGRWIASHGNLRVIPDIGAFAHQPGLTFFSNAMYANHDGSLSFQFAHLLPTVLAEAHRVGGDRLMFATPALLCGIALLAFFVAAWRLLRNRYVALAALVSFAFIIPEVSFSRDTYSELPTQVLLFTGLWVLADRRALRRPRVALFVGIMLGLLQAVRIDAIAELLGLPVLFAVTWILADERNRRSIAVSAGACAIGLVPGLVLGFTDLGLRAGRYLHDLRPDVKQLFIAMTASILVSFLAVAIATLAGRSGLRVPRLDRAAWGVAAFVAVVGFGAWWIRPHIQHAHGVSTPLIAGLQQGAHVAIDPTRTYAERSMVWMSWYLGPLTVFAAIVGAALLVRWLLRGHARFSLALLALLGPPSAIYLWKPSAAADQIWVTRRYLISAFPLLILLAFGVVAALVHWASPRVPSALTVATVVVAVAVGAGMVAYPFSTVVPLRNMTEQRGDAGIIRDACGLMGPHAAVVVLATKTGSLAGSVPQTLRGWCGTPVAVMSTKAVDGPAKLARLAKAWAASGSRLWVVGDDPATIKAVLPSVQIDSTPVAISRNFLERTLVRRPSHYVPTLFSLTLARVPPG
jgi:hypothetical protein